MSAYPYASGNLLKKRNTYFYTPYEGIDFLRSWKKDRARFIEKLRDEGVPPKGTPVISIASLKSKIEAGDVVVTQDFLETLFYFLEQETSALPDEIPDFVDLLVQRFEVSKRIHEAYGKRFRSVDVKAYHNIELYVRAAEVYEAAYAHYGSLPYLNVLLKCVDTLCSIEQQLSDKQKHRVCRLVVKEREHVFMLSESIGVAI